jgi:hypothetical protein
MVTMSGIAPKGNVRVVVGVAGHWWNMVIWSPALVIAEEAGGEDPQQSYRPFLLTLYALIRYAADSGNRYSPEDAYIPGSYPAEGRPGDGLQWSTAHCRPRFGYGACYAMRNAEALVRERRADRRAKVPDAIRDHCMDDRGNQRHHPVCVDRI